MQLQVEMVATKKRAYKRVKISWKVRSSVWLECSACIRKAGWGIRLEGEVEINEIKDASFMNVLIV